ncbi:Protein Shroom3 [Liparis tanakae]|uniref:Protein Shroom3 n=1 Tax=Liparis tanakae TaxID=230148 RepID=A0A4Z2FBZ7_9TELE|nr:Protein Shroom3 [Liparis tanakae]
MESLDPPQSSQLPPGAGLRPLGRHAHSGPHPAYSSCHQLSSARSSSSIDHLHSKRDSAYSSFSTSSSIPEYLASDPERCSSLEAVPHGGGGGADSQQGQELELSSASRGEGGAGPGRDPRGSGGEVCHGGGGGGGGAVGPARGPAASQSSPESLKAAALPAPPRRSDSYAAIRSRDRPVSWSSLEHGRAPRSLQKGSWHHSSGPVASSAAKGPFGAEGQLHTVVEKSPESSPTTRPRQGGGPPPAPDPTGPSLGLAGPAPQPGRLAGPAPQPGRLVGPAPQLEPHHAPRPGPSGGHEEGAGGREGGAPERRRDRRMSAPEHGYLSHLSSSLCPYSSSSAHEAHR